MSLVPGREPASCSHQVRQYLRGRLADTRSSNIEATAAHLRVLVRTLQRRLRAEGADFQALLSRVRADGAKELLRDPNRKVLEIAMEVGFAEERAFARAFRRWTGMAPREFRLQQRT